MRSLDEIVRVVAAAADAAGASTAGANAAGAHGATGVPRIIVGIAGSPGAGKSTIAASLVTRLQAAPAAWLGSAGRVGPADVSGLPDSAVRQSVLLPLDGFHFPQSRLVELGRRDRMGAPDTFDVGAFVAALTAVRTADAPVSIPGFDRQIEQPVADAITIGPGPRIVVVEGNYLLHASGGWEHVQPLLDLSLFVDLARDIRWERLVTRHEQFGKTPEAARAWATGPDERNAELIEACAVRADHQIRLEAV
nr:nucleoside/nucleotide kinase family protein [Leifsonia psychrotolerans]